MTRRDQAMASATRFVRLMEQAKKLGGHAADAYWDEFGAKPTRETAGDWDESAWSVARKELADAGMDEAAYDGCLVAWRHGFFGDIIDAEMPTD